MMRHLLLGLFVAMPLSAQAADLEAIVDDLILPALSDFDEASRSLALSAAADCMAPAVRPAYDAAFDAWLPVAVFRMGPTEAGALGVAFWPDEKGLTPKSLRDRIAAADPAALTPEAMADASVAARGLLALDQMLGDPELSAYPAGSYSCDLVRAIAGDLAAQATALRAGWTGGFADVVETAGKPGNSTFLAPEEAVKALYTQLLTGIEFAADNRIGRPLGTFDKPRPTRAEAWRTGRPLRNLAVSLDALEALASALATGDTPLTTAAFASVREAAAKLTDPSLADIGDAAVWLKAEIVQQRLRALYDAVEAEVGTHLGVEAGFNSLDGD